MQEKSRILLRKNLEAGIDAAYNGNIPVICVPDMLQPSQAHKDKAEVVLEDLSQAIDYIENM